MNIAHVGAAPVNFGKGRQGHRILAVVVHIMEGSMYSTAAWFANPKARVSAHYGVSRTGEVVQYVDDADEAYHAGIVRNPTAELVKQNEGVNPNLWTIGVEHEGYATQEPTPAQMVASAELLALLSTKHGIPLDKTHVIPHRAIRADKSCPGRIQVPALLSLAQGAAKAGPKPTDAPRPGDRRFSAFLDQNVILTRFVSDDEWFYLPESQLREMGQRASSPWSAFPAPKP